MLSLPLLAWPTPLPSPSCPPSQLPIHLPSPGSHLPWSHHPRCITTPSRDNNNKELCVFTSTAFNPPLGLSIVASPAAATDLVQAGLLPTGTQSPEKTGEKEAKYESRSLSHMGVGLFVKKGKHFAPGEVIFVDHPTLMIPVPDVDGGAAAELVEELSWQGVMQLPTRGRDLTRGLAREMGRSKDDELVDVVDTNAFSQVKGGRGWNLVFPRAAVSFLSGEWVGGEGG